LIGNEIDFNLRNYIIETKRYLVLSLKQREWVGYAAANYGDGLENNIYETAVSGKTELEKKPNTKL
jgi:hypothetical protein